MSKLGLSDSAGLRQERAEAMARFREVRLSLIDEVVSEIDKSNSNYIDSHNLELAEESNRAIVALEDLVEKYDWQDIVIGKNTNHYREVFSRIDTAVREIVSISNNAEQAGNNLQLQIVTQSEALQSGGLLLAAY